MIIEFLNNKWCITVPAKVNLFLEVVGKRPDGYHNLDTVMTSISLVDQLHFSLREDREIVLSIKPLQEEGFQKLIPTDGAWDIPNDEKNLVFRALDSVRRSYGVTQGMDVELLKSIPAQAGLGGGSADAAAAILGGMIAWSGLYDHSLAKSLAASLGSDINFFLETAYSGFFSARCTGRGEIVDTIRENLSIDFVVIHPPLGCSTKEVFGRVSAAHIIEEPQRSALNMTELIERGDRMNISKSLWNRLYEPAMELNPWLKQIASILALEQGVHGFGLSGSGSAIFAVMQSGQEAEELKNKLTEKNLFRVYHVSCWRSAKIQQQLESMGLNLNS